MDKTGRIIIANAGLNIGKNMDIKLDEKTHIYTITNENGKIEQYPSVTQIISDGGLSDFSHVSPDILERACNFGKATHKMVELKLKGTLNEEELDPALHGPLEAFKEWYSDHCYQRGGLSDSRLEVPSFHPKLHYCGTPDIVFPKLLIDIKSRLSPLANALQCCAYDEMDGGDREHRILILNQDGTYQYLRVNATKAKRRESWSRFRYLLDLHERKMEISKWK